MSASTGHSGEVNPATPRSVVVGLVCFQFVWELIISAMVATWTIWLSCLLSLLCSKIRIDSP